MSNVEKFKVISDEKFGVILQCSDVELADQFDDFLIENFDHEVSFKFEEGCVSFFFGKELSVPYITDLYKKFVKEIN